MRLLLDTHVFVWSLLEPERLPARLRATLIDPAHIVHVSVVTVWEVVIKNGLGKLSLPLDRLDATIGDAGFGELPATTSHALEVRRLRRCTATRSTAC